MLHVAARLTATLVLLVIAGFHLVFAVLGALLRGIQICLGHACVLDIHSILGEHFLSSAPGPKEFQTSRVHAAFYAQRPG